MMNPYDRSIHQQELRDQAARYFPAFLAKILDATVNSDANDSEHHYDLLAFATRYRNEIQDIVWMAYREGQHYGRSIERRTLMQQQPDASESAGTASSPPD